MKKLLTAAILMATTITSSVYAGNACRNTKFMFPVSLNRPEGHTTVLADAQTALAIRRANMPYASLSGYVFNVTTTRNHYAAKPLRSYWNSTTYNNFYTISNSDANYVLRNGWRQQGSLGYIYPYPIGGESLKPLYRLHKVWGHTPAGGYDLEHYYTTYQDNIRRLKSRGFQVDGVVGWVCPN